MKIAIACSGLGHLRRGFETFAEDLYGQLRKGCEDDVLLFAGGGRTVPPRYALWNVPRGSPFWRLSHPFVSPYVGEQLTFALSLARKLKEENVAIVHVSDCQLASFLARLLRGLQNRPRILFSNGGPMSPADYRGFDFIHQVNPLEMERAIAAGVSSNRMMLVPYGVDTERFRPTEVKALRRRIGIPDESFLVLTVGAHGAHKRLDYLVREIAGAGDDVHLLVAGQSAGRETKSLQQLARDLLGDRVSFVSLLHEAMPDAYASADLYLHTALREGFGLALLEAMACGLPIVYHDEAVMSWIVNDAGIAVDMTKEGIVAETIRSMRTGERDLRRLAERARRRAEETFSWGSVLHQYRRLYREVLITPRTEGRLGRRSRGA